jgi:hypothetical protein
MENHINLKIIFILLKKKNKYSKLKSAIKKT